MSNNHAGAPLAASEPTAGAAFVLGLGIDGPSPSRKAGARGRTSLGGSRIPHHSTGVRSTPAADIEQQSTSAVPEPRQAWAYTTASQAQPSAQQPSGSAPADGVPQVQAPKVARVPTLNLHHIGLSGAGPAPPAPNDERKGPSGAATSNGASAGARVPTFDIGMAGQDRPTPGGARTPKAGRGRAGRSKPPSASPLPAASTAVGATPSLSPILLTPFDDNTYQKTARTVSVGEASPMEITPSSTVASAAPSIFELSPMAGGAMAGQGGGAGLQAGAGGSQGVPLSPPPFQGFLSATETAAAPIFPASARASNSGTGAASQAAASGPAAPSAPRDAAGAAEASGSSGALSSSEPTASASNPAPPNTDAADTAPPPARTSGGVALPADADSVEPEAAPMAATAGPGAAATNTSGYSVPRIQIPIPGAREVNNLFSSLCRVHTGPGGSLPGRDGSMTARGGETRRDTTAQRARDGFVTARDPPSGRGAPSNAGLAELLRNRGIVNDLASASAGTASAAAGKKLTGTSDVADSMADGAGSGSAGQTGGNDCQPAKDNAPKSVRIAADSSACGAGPGPNAAAAQAAPSSGTAPPAGGAAAGGGAASQLKPSSAGPSAAPASAAGTAAVPGASLAKAEAVAAALGCAAMSAVVASAHESEPHLTSPELWSAVTGNLLKLARRCEAATAAAAAAKAIKASPEAAADAVREALAGEDSPAVKAVLEQLLRPEVLGTRPSSGVVSEAWQKKPPASLSSMLDKLKLGDSQAGSSRIAEPAAASAAGGAAASGSQAFGASNGVDAAVAPATAAAAPASPIPFVFGAASVTSSGGSGSGSVGGGGSSGVSGAPAATTSTSGPQTFGAAAAAAGSRPAPFAAPASAAAPPPSPASIPFVFGSTTPASSGAGNVGAQASGAGAGTSYQAGAPSATFGFGAAPFGAAGMAAGSGFQTAASGAAFGTAPFGAAAPTAATAAGRPGSRGSTTPPPWGTTFGGVNMPPQQAAQAAPTFPATSAASSGLRPMQSGVSFSGAPAPSFASSAGGASPMSTTPVSSSHQQEARPTVSSSSFSWNGATHAAAAATPVSDGGEALKFNVGSSGGAADAGGAAAAAGAAGITPGRRQRSKVTPRKVRAGATTDGTSAQRSSAAGGFAAAFAAGVSAGAPPVAAFNGAAAHSGASERMAFAGQSASASQQAQSARQTQQSQPAADQAHDALIAQAQRLKRSADEKKQLGNQKYGQHDFMLAEGFYTEALDVLERQLRALPLPSSALHQLFPGLQTELAVLYSNRSGARLMTSKPQSALDDALQAMNLDAKFSRAPSRVATCYCRLGNFAAAHKIVQAAIDRFSATSSKDFKDMMKKMEEVVELNKRARAATTAAASAASSGVREKLQEAASHLAAIKEQVTYCDVIAAARAVLAIRLGSCRDGLMLIAPHPEVPVALRSAPWRLWLTVQAHYLKGDLQVALGTLRDLQTVMEAAGGSATTAEATQADGAASGSDGLVPYSTASHVKIPEVATLAELVDKMQQQIKLKEDGNTAVKAGRHTEAVDMYTRALALDCCPAYAAVLHSNRAAAYQLLGQLAEAVADCCRARALDLSFYRASSRLATLMVELRRPDEAQKLLDPLLKLDAQSGGSGPSSEELSKFKEQLTQARSAVDWQKTPQHYKLLGLNNTCSEEDVRKAYRRLALKHHPDKAMSAVRMVLSLPGPAGGAPYSGPMASGAELEERVRREAAWLFNFINQANEELSDKARRRKVDQLLEVEQPPAARHGAGTSSNPYGSSFYAGSRYSGYGASAYNDFNFYNFRSSAAGGAAGAGGSARTRTTTGGGATGANNNAYGAYGGYGSYGGARPAGARPAAPPGANSGAAGTSRGGSGNAAAGAGRPGGAANGGYAGYARNGGGGGASRAAPGGRKWWEGGAEDSEEDDADSFNF